MAPRVHRLAAGRVTYTENEEAYVGRSPYSSEKRRKELDRLKKQEEKRQRRFNKKNERENTEVPPEGAPNPEETPATDEGPKDG